MATTLIFPPRATRDLSDETFDWTRFLKDGVIADANVVVEGDGDLVIESKLVGPKTVTVDLSGGTAGRTYTLICEIVLADGRRFERTAKVSVKARL